jgi:dTDP-4-amino-4,6-dideoxygalactose transaminase
MSHTLSPPPGNATAPDAAALRETLPPWPYYGPAERAAVDAVLASGKVNYWTGNESRRFEQEYARYLGVEHAIALANGTVALELTLRMWNVGAADEVIVTPRSFIASTSCAVLLGARPVFADVDRNSGNVTAETIARVLTPRTRAIIPVHLAGWPCDMQGIMSLAEEHDIKVLEDCAQAHGARCNGKPVGSLAHAAAFSFCQDKIISTGGEGGLLATRDEALWESAWSFKDHGKTWGGVHQLDHEPGFRWLHGRFGTNWRLTEPQAAIGRIQLRKLDDWVEKRRRNAAILAERLGALPALRIPPVPARMYHAYYKFYAYVRPRALRAGWSRDRLLAEIAEQGVPCFSGSCPEIYRERAFENTRWAPAERLPVAAELGETSLMFLVHPTLEEDHLHRVCDAVERVVAAGTL